ncbi:hypothetical protein F53441_1188 [Fusarium austroafricanum]|uniref:Uncharacterized protein n=1 Tax=Fusarium austroafricanum TaxID=2364996 RepID=A0A8H4PDL7_9HYPO|nr:hypothetical protein F53441_1188 [Fusarium austroafricanum]
MPSSLIFNLVSFFKVPRSKTSTALPDSGCAASSNRGSDHEVYQSLVDSSEEGCPFSNCQYVSSASAGETSTGRASSLEEAESPTWSDFSTEISQEERDPSWGLFERKHEEDFHNCTLHLKPEYAAKWPKSRRPGVSEQGGWTGEYSNPSDYGAEPSSSSPWSGQYSGPAEYGQHGALPLPTWTGEYSKSESEVGEPSQVKSSNEEAASQ